MSKAHRQVSLREEIMGSIQRIGAPTRQRLGVSKRLGASIGSSLLLLTVGLCSVIAPSPALAQETLMRVLTVSGRGETTIPTTLARVSAGVEVEAETAEAAQAEAARRSSAVVDFLRSRNVDKLETTGIRLNPVYSYNDDQPRIRAYQAVNIVSFQVPTADNAGSLLDDIVQAGATRIDGISFIASDSAIADARDTALQAATQDAQRQAGVVLNSLNFSPQEIVGIQINGANAPGPVPLPAARLELAEADYTTPVVGGEQVVQATVTLEIRY